MGGLTLTIAEGAWRAHLADAVARWPDLIPVVKGNGYGFGRATLARIAATLYETALAPGPLGAALAVGTVHEVGDVPSSCRPVVLTPLIDDPPVDLRDDAVLTIGSRVHTDMAARLVANGAWRGQVLVKLCSSMHRYGCHPDEHDDLLAQAIDFGLTAVGYSLHLPLASEPRSSLTEVEAWLAMLDDGLPITLSHLDAATYTALRERFGDHRFAYRAGTALWHGDKSMLSLTAPVIDVRPVRAGEAVGYHLRACPADGYLVMIAAGTAHGVHPLPGGASPFHFARQRLGLVEPPHMHTSMALVPSGRPCPEPGDHVDVQHPLTQTLVDCLAWTP